MAYRKGMIPKDKVTRFCTYLRDRGYQTRSAHAQYEMYQVMMAGKWLAITVDGKGSVGLPEELWTVCEDFLLATFSYPSEAPTINDTMRLDFLLSCGMQMVTSLEGYNFAGENHYHVFLEGPMGTKSTEGVRFLAAGDATELLAKAKRDVIDQAINNPRNLSVHA